MIHLQKKQTMREKRIAFQRFMLRKSFRMGLMVIFVLFLVLDVMKTTGVSTSGYNISVLQQQVHELEQENQRITTEIASYRSMQSIQERLQGMNLVSADNPTYMTSIQTAVARR